jgi:hypothetical protein
MRNSPLEHPEVHPPHARHGGLPRWLEMLIAVTALITSICSIVIAVHHGKIMEKLVQANSLPYMQGGFSDVQPGGEQQLIFRMFRKDENAQYWDLLEKAQEKWEFEFCYCSVFDECWEVLGKWEEPKPVQACVRDEPHEFMP